MFEPTLTKVHEDSRGAMYSIALPGDRELMILHSKAGSLRGGHSHDVPEAILVLDGKLVYHKVGPDGEYIEELTGGDTDFHPPGDIHMGEFPEDTWLLEWKICRDKHSWKNTNHEPMRAKVRANAGG